MKKNKFISGATQGSAFEEEFFAMLDNANIPYRKEETLSSGKRRRKDKKCDIEAFIGGKSVFIECKTLWDDKSLEYDVFDKGLNCNLKYHQIKAMHYLVIKFRPHSKIESDEIYMVHKRDFVLWAIEQTKKSASLKDFKKIGTLITDARWLIES